MTINCIVAMTLSLGVNCSKKHVTWKCASLVLTPWNYQNENTKLKTERQSLLVHKVVSNIHESLLIFN